MTDSRELRDSFLSFFESKGHSREKSSPLIPAKDPTLMFTNAGMVQFKDVFTGEEKRSYSRAATSQRCMRVSGKHNDLEEVGRTTRHHTFFEMLGNFSFGDYFKEGAIEYAWEYVTKEVGLDPSKLWVTVFEGDENVPADDEARQLWKKISGLPDARIVGMGAKDNFWAMGETGPCGPCSEIHYDTGSGPVSMKDFESGRVVEFWNLVFMQFVRPAKGAPLIALPRPSVDTGMGLERLLVLVNGEDSNYHTDLFLPLLETVAEKVGKPYRRSDSEDDVSMRVIADHARATAALVADGLQPSNEGRGYVMRRIMRRAIRHGKRLGFETPFFREVCENVVSILGSSFPELSEAKTLIGKVSETEEASFRRTLDTGLKLLEQTLEQTRQSGAKTLPGNAVFKLYDTFGFPKDLTETIAGERGFDIDEAGFAAALAEQQERSRGSAVGDEAVSGIYKQLAQKYAPIEFVGYPHEDIPVDQRDGEWRKIDNYLQRRVQVVALIRDGVSVDRVEDGEIEVITAPTPFYGESGGQVGDRGRLDSDGLRVEIRDVQKPVDGLTVAQGKVGSGVLEVGMEVWAGYPVEERKRTRAHHSATHLVHSALRGVLGEHVKQAGSMNSPSRLRFDFSHFEAATPDELRAIEDDANARVAAGSPVVTQVLPYDEAKNKGAIALFGEKYGDEVRVVTMGDSVEFCGGTHVANTDEIDVVLLTREEAVASGVRRIEAEVGAAARATTEQTAAKLAAAAQILAGAENLEFSGDPILQAVAKTKRAFDEGSSQLKAAGEDPVALVVPTPSSIPLPERYGFTAARQVRDAWQLLTRLTNAKASEAEAIAKASTEIDKGGVLAAYAELHRANRDIERRLEGVRARAASATTDTLLDSVEEIGGIRILAALVDGLDGKALRGLADTVRDKLGSGVVALGSVSGGKCSLLIGVSKELTSTLKAGDLVKELAPLIGGRGGGKPDLAQAGGSDPSGFETLFAQLKQRIATPR